MSEYDYVSECLEGARNGRLCAGAETAVVEIKRLTDALEQAQEQYLSWKPTAENINTLPKPLFEYIYHLETMADPAGMVAENTLLKDQTKQLDAMIGRLKARTEQLEAALHPGKQSCDCCIRQQYKGETFWMIECQCGNHDDIGRAQAWCSMANSYEGATGKSVTAGYRDPND